jgi:hypothetical protein
MKLLYGIINIIGIFLACLFLVFFMEYNKKLEDNFWEYHLRIVSDKAAEAAFADALKSENINIDYINLDSAEVSPQRSLDVYADMMCLAYDMVPTDSNRQLIKEHIAVAILATNNGFYVTETVEVDTTNSKSIKQEEKEVLNKMWGYNYQVVPEEEQNGGEYTIAWGLKRPYLMNIDDYTYALSMKDGSWLRAREQVHGGSYVLTDLERGPTYPPGIERGNLLSKINADINAEVAYQIQQRNKVVIDEDKGLSTNINTYAGTFFLPSELTNGVNTINKPTFLILIQNTKFNSISKLSSVSASGYSIGKKRLVLGFIENGVRYYCYEGQLPNNKIGSIVDIYRSPKEAVINGYQAHLEYLPLPLN